MKTKKYILSILLFLVIIFFTFYSIFYDNSINDVFNKLTKISIIYIFVCLLLILIYFILQGIYIKLMLGVLKHKIPLKSGVVYSLIEFFFSGITPSSSGGQPAQLYYMKEDKIPLRKSLITLTINTIYFKLIMVILSLLVLVFKNSFIANNSTFFKLFFFFGIIIDITIIIFGYLLLYKQSIIKKILEIIENIKRKLKRKGINSLENKLLNYKTEVHHLKKHKKEVIIGFIITLIQRICLFSISYIVYKSFSLNSYNYLNLIVIQISVTAAIEGLPLPGGTGVSEHLMNTFYVTIFGNVLSSTGMLLTRFFSFYLPLIVSGIIVLICTIRKKHN